MFQIDETDMPPQEDLAPERQLIASVIRAAVEDILSPPPRAMKNGANWSHMRDDAAAWMSSNSRRPFSFLWCCDALGLDAAAVRWRIVQAPRDVWFSLATTGQGNRFAKTARLSNAQLLMGVQ